MPTFNEGSALAKPTYNHIFVMFLLQRGGRARYWSVNSRRDNESLCAETPTPT
jgi:hypothetical protein